MLKIELNEKEELTNGKLIKQYEEMCNSELATEEQKLRIEKLKKEIAKDNTQETLMEDDGFTKAIENATKEVWRDD